MKIIPAVDIKDGKVVRLIQGRFDEVTQYSDDPIAVSKVWQDQGAEMLHVVDLDGAKTGVSTNAETIIAIAKALDIPIQTGGGIRSVEDVERLITNGVSRVILGTRAIEDKAFLTTVLKKYGEQIIISLDCSKGMVAQRGWTRVSTILAIDFAKELEQAGVKCLIYTDIARDGMLSGPNFEELERLLRAVNVDVIVSGGISKIDDVKKLLEFEPAGLVGAITGKAIYEEKLNLPEAIKLCS